MYGMAAIHSYPYSFRECKDIVEIKVRARRRRTGATNFLLILNSILFV